MHRKLTGRETITVVANNNPKRMGTGAHTRFSQYKTGMTVDQYREAVGDPTKARRDLRWDSKRRHIRLRRA